MPFDGTELSSATQALIKGRQQIERGWCQGRGRSRQGVCAIVALDGHRDAIRLLQQAMGPPFTVANWNDAVGRTKADVLALYDCAIALSL